jgi:hypothetical protein
MLGEKRVMPMRDGLTIRAGASTSRRMAMGGLAALGLCLTDKGGSARQSRPDLLFRVLRKGSEIGTHRVAFTPTSSGFDVDVAIELVVKVAFITVFRYRQTAHDSWQGGNLVAADYTTDDDGRQTSVHVRETHGRLRIDGAAGRREAPLGTMTDLSFWNESIIDAPRLVDSQTGELGIMRTEARRRERVTIKGRHVEAKRYSVSGSHDRGGHVWYVDGQWVKASFITRGEALDYVLA